MNKDFLAACVFLALVCIGIFLVLPPVSQQTDKSSLHADSVQFSTGEGTEGYVIKKGNHVYFLANINFASPEELEEYIREQLKREHPTDTTLGFDDRNFYKQLNTGDKLKIWYSRILESYPARIPVEKVEVLEQSRIQ